jgi:hypothetical protein
MGIIDTIKKYSTPIIVIIVVVIAGIIIYFKRSQIATWFKEKLNGEGY